MIKVADEELTTTIQLRVSKRQHREIKRKAKKHTKGNISKWIRYASAELDPRPEDVADARTN